MKTDLLNDCDKHDLSISIENLLFDTVPNLGSVITLDNKGRLINSQFSKPSSSQTLLKLNSSEEVPDADDLPYSVISYGDTPNAINLPYNDHNYIGNQNNKNLKNYDKKALEYTTKLNIQYSQRSHFSPHSNLHISQLNNGSFNSNCLSQNDFINTRTDNLFFNEKMKINNNQYNFHPSTANTLTPLINSKFINNHHKIQQIQPNHNGFLATTQMLPNTIVINPNNVNKLKTMSVIKLQQSSLDNNRSTITNLNEPKVINVPTIKKTNLSNIIVSNDQITLTTGGVVSGGPSCAGTDNEIINSSPDKPDKTINLIPRCICGFMHDDGGMIRCEVCQTWQHIICMYPDNKFPILYKCEKCEPREIDYNRAIATQTNNLIKAGKKVSDYHANLEYVNYENDTGLENVSRQMSHIAPQYVIVQPEMKTPFRHIQNSMHNGQNSIYITNSKDSQLVTPGSPRTSKRKQDLISLKNVLTKPTNSNAALGPFTVNNIVIHNINKTKNDFQKPALVVDHPVTSGSFNNYLISTSTTNQSQLLLDQRIIDQSLVNNEMSGKLRSIMCSKIHPHTNLTIEQEHHLRQRNFVIYPETSCEVIRIKFSQHVIKSIVELTFNEIIMEFNGFISLAEEYNKEFDFRKHYNPFALFYDKFDHLTLCIDAKETNSESKYIRRSCTPNSEVKHRLTKNGQIKFYIVPINRISKGVEITIAFDFNYMKCRYPVECACNQETCELNYMRLEESQSKKLSNFLPNSITSYDTMYCEDNRNLSTTLTRPHKKRGRAAKILNIANRQIVEKPTIVAETKGTTIIRSNKRGRPPLNRSNGIQRSDVCLKKPSQNSQDNNCLTEFKEVSDNDSIYCRTNENIQPNLQLHSNFKNFKRISSSYWSLKSFSRKLSANNGKSRILNKQILSPEIDRSIKYKKTNNIIETEKSIENSSDLPPSSPEEYHIDNEREKSIELSNGNYDDEFETDAYNQYSGDLKQEMNREDQGKYWLEEINNKIYKQRIKEAKKFKRKGKLDRKIKRKFDDPKKCDLYGYDYDKIELELANQVENNETMENNTDREEQNKSDEKINKRTQQCSVEIVKEKKTHGSYSIGKAKGGKKNLKPNKNYIVSYRASNIDDLKNDLMLISASLKEEPKEPEDQEDDTDDKVFVTLKPEPTVVSESFSEQKESMSEDYTFAESVISETIEKSISESLTTKKSKSETMESDYSNKFLESSDEKIQSSFGSKNRKSNSSKSKEKIAKDVLKASREERWVNAMWQRILQNENSDIKLKRKRNKTSLADESNVSEENNMETNELSSPKFGDSDFCDDNMSCENKDFDNNNVPFKLLTPPFKNKRKVTNQLKLSLNNEVNNEKHNVHLHQQQQQNTRTPEMTSDVKTEASLITIPGASEDIENKLQEPTDEQCGLIVYKEQQSNPMEKFSRKNSVHLFNDNYAEGNLTSSISVSSHPPHTKKRWLSQALLEENLIDDDNKTNDGYIEKCSVLESNSKHSFLPPVITSAIPLTPSKVTMNPKKRLLNQFSMEDNAFAIDSSEITEFKSKKWDHQYIDQEQSKTKLTLSEYRKRRYCDNSGQSSYPTIISNENQVDSEHVKNLHDRYALGKDNVRTDIRDCFETSKQSDVSHNNFLGLNINTESSYLSESGPNNQSINEYPLDQPNSCSSLSYLNTLNKLKMPGNLDPRLTKSMGFFDRSQQFENTANCIRTIQNTEPIESQIECSSNIKTTLIVSNCSSLSKSSPNSVSDLKKIRSNNDRGPRTPSDLDDFSVSRHMDRDYALTHAPSQVSIDSLESQPSPTSDSHFEFDKSDILNRDHRKTNFTCSVSGNDYWTSNATTIGLMAGVQYPDMLEEIEEFDDEYLPLPDKLPERTKEEMETLLFTMKRDSQIREWQEVKQIEREKVKLEHQVRSMQRRMQRGTRNSEGKVALGNCKSPMENDRDNNQEIPRFNNAYMNDEKTMKTFHFQLSSFNNHLVEQINNLKNNIKPLTKTVHQSTALNKVDLPLSYRFQNEDEIDISVTNNKINLSSSSNMIGTISNASNSIAPPPLQKSQRKEKDSFNFSKSQPEFRSRENISRDGTSFVSSYLHFSCVGNNQSPVTTDSLFNNHQKNDILSPMVSQSSSSDCAAAIINNNSSIHSISATTTIAETTYVVPNLKSVYPKMTPAFM